jgi:hypothetical protein
VEYEETIRKLKRVTRWNWRCVSGVGARGRTIGIADAHRDGKRFIVRADEKLTAFVELESSIRLSSFSITLFSLFPSAFNDASLG